MLLLARTEAQDFSQDEDHAALKYAATHNCVALCTIVEIDGSFSRRLGAQLAIGKQSFAGSLTDGCLERELASQAAALVYGQRKVLRFGRGSPFIDFRLPCGSGLDILIDSAPDRTAIARALDRLEQRQPATLSLPIHSPEQLQNRRYIPPLRLVVFGSGPEVMWMERLAVCLGTRCEVYGPQTGLALGAAPSGIAIDQWTTVLLLFHDHEWETSLLRWAVDTPAFLVGAIGGHRARENRRKALGELGVAQAAIERIRSPIGLIEHTRDPRSLAISILGEVVSDYENLRP